MIARKVAVLYPSSLPWMAQLLDGIRRYGLQAGGWELLTCPPALAASGERPRSLRSLVGWKGDAAIAAVRTAEERNLVGQLGIPVVNLSSWDRETHGIPRVSVDNTAIGHLAAEHLVSRGLKHLGYVGWKSVHYSQQRLAGFTRRATQAGVRVSTKLDAVDEESDRTIAEELLELGGWLKSLPRPCGVFAVQDYRAKLVMEACVSAGLRVPRDVAVLGVDDDAIVCEHTMPTLSSVSRNSGQVGWEIGALIDRLLRGETSADTEVLVPPDGVADRQSTDLFHHVDEVVQLAVSFMRWNLKGPLKIGAVAEHAGVSKRTLEMRFRSATGMSPHRYLTEVRVRHAQKLIGRPSRQNLREIASDCGFSSYPAFIAAFRSVSGSAPGEFSRTSAPTT